MPYLFAVFLETIVRVLSSVLFAVGYVSNVNSFPQPLTQEEEAEIIWQYKEGSEEARNILIEKNLRLVAHVVKKYNTHATDCDDLISIGTIGLIKAIMTYDTNKGTRLATYAHGCIDNEILCTSVPVKVQNEVSLQDRLALTRKARDFALDVMENDSIRCGWSGIEDANQNMYKKMKRYWRTGRRLSLNSGTAFAMGMGRSAKCENTGNIQVLCFQDWKESVKKLNKELKVSYDW